MKMSYMELPPWDRQHHNSRPNILLKFPQFYRDRWERTDRTQLYRYVVRVVRLCRWDAQLSWMNSHLLRMPHAYNLRATKAENIKIDKWFKLHLAHATNTVPIVIVAISSITNCSKRQRTQQINRFFDIVNVYRCSGIRVQYTSYANPFSPFVAKKLFVKRPTAQLNQTHIMLRSSDEFYVHQPFNYSIWIKHILFSSGIGGATIWCDTLTKVIMQVSSTRLRFYYYYDVRERVDRWWGGHVCVCVCLFSGFQWWYVRSTHSQCASRVMLNENHSGNCANAGPHQIR